MTNVFFQTYGCSLNKADTEFMMGVCKSKGYSIVNNPDDAEAIVLNTCAVKKITETKFFNNLKKFEELRKPIVITGCIAQTMPGKLAGYALLGPDHLSEIVEILEETMHKNPIQILSREKTGCLDLPKVRQNDFIEIIPISKGCLGDCSYCIVKNARGEFFSYPKEAIVRHAKKAVMDGCKEIWVTAQDTGCYGKDIGSSLLILLRELSAIPGDFFIRVGMMNPNHVYEMLEDLIEIFKADKIFKFLHIPVQSGNDGILKKMNRFYTIAEFCEIIDQFRKEIPEMTIATDIIAGYPGETKEQFKDSIELINKVKPDVVNISKFGPRLGTKAAKAFPLSGEIVKERSRTLSSVFSWISFENNKKWRNWEGRIIIDELGKDGSFVGRNYVYKPVIVNGNYKLGQIINVKIENITTFDLRGIEI